MALSTIGRNQLNTGIDDNSDATAVTISSDELVGIGTASPAVPLHVKASAPGFALQTSGSMTSGNRADFSAYNSDTSTVGLIRFGAVTDNVGTNVQFYSRPAGGSLTERMRILSSGGISFNGDTAAANALDDYEEGTWNLALNGGVTPTTTQSSYTKIGNIVFLSCTFSVASNSVNTAIVISGIPYTAAENGGGTLAYTPATTVNSFGILVQGTQIYFYKGTASTNYTLQDFSGHSVVFTAQYKTA